MVPKSRRWLAFLFALLTTCVAAAALGTYVRLHRGDDPATRSIYGGDAPWTQGRPASLKEFFTPVGWEIMQSPTKVEAFNLSPEAGPNDPESVAEPYDGLRKLEAKAVIPSAEVAERLRLAFLDEKIYDLTRGGGGKCGGYRPHEAVRFWRGRASIAFLVCFTCRDIGVIVHDERGKVLTLQLSKAQVRGEVLEAIRAALPEDRYIDRFRPRRAPASTRAVGEKQ